MKSTSDFQIVATLKHGKVLERKYRIFFWICLIFILACSAIAIIAMLVDFLWDTSEEKIPTLDFAVITAVLLAIDIFLCVLLGYLLKRDGKYRQEIKEWPVDSVKLKAYCEECDDKQIFVPLIHNVSCVGNIKVTFHYKGDKKILRSNLYSNNRYGTVFTRFVGKEIYIMYSPKYKQVMFIDEPCEQPQSLEIL